MKNLSVRFLATCNLNPLFLEYTPRFTLRLISVFDDVQSEPLFWNEKPSRTACDLENVVSTTVTEWGIDTKRGPETTVRRNSHCGLSQGANRMKNMCS